MFNYYRWFPKGKVVFMAPTRPLVAQQIEACHNIVGNENNHKTDLIFTGITNKDIAEMTGTMPPKERDKRWIDRRVFFVTPQILANDIKRGACKASEIVCVVVDEAHRAQGKHSYCNVIREISGATRYFR
jgi:Fanconi anemia group M protein